MTVPNVDEIMAQMPNMGGGQNIDEEDFADFMSRVDAIGATHTPSLPFSVSDIETRLTEPPDTFTDEAVKGLKDGNLSVEDVDKKYAPILEEVRRPTHRETDPSASSLHIFHRTPLHQAS